MYQHHDRPGASLDIMHSDVFDVYKICRRLFTLSILTTRNCDARCATNKSQENECINLEHLTTSRPLPSRESSGVETNPILSVLTDRTHNCDCDPGKNFQRVVIREIIELL